MNGDYENVVPNKKHKLLRSFVKLIAAGMVFGLVAGASLQGYNYLTNKDEGNYKNVLVNNLDETDVSNPEQSDSNTKNTQVDENTLGEVDAVETGVDNKKITSDVSTIVENVMPSIVAINSVVTNVSNDLFGRQYSQEIPGSGSGIIIGQNDSEILIVTNNHVIKDANSVEIIFADDTTVNATVKGTAPSSDLAVVSVNLEDLEEGTVDNIKIATLGDSDTIRLGEMSIAIGNALGYGQSVTVGYISAIDREVPIDGITLNLLQTDAAINPGNSGGALLNSKGEVIGINSVKYVDEGVESIGYAIPISDAIPIINELMNRTTLEEEDMAYLGIAGKDVIDAYALGFNMPIGFYVGQIVEDSAADNAGIKVGDIITAINKIKVQSIRDIQDILTYTPGGSTGTVTIQSLENGKYVEKTVEITFDYRPNN